MSWVLNCSPHSVSCDGAVRRKGLNHLQNAKPLICSRCCSGTLSSTVGLQAVECDSNCTVSPQTRTAMGGCVRSFKLLSGQSKRDYPIGRKVPLLMCHPISKHRRPLDLSLLLKMLCSGSHKVHTRSADSFVSFPQRSRHNLLEHALHSPTHISHLGHMCIRIPTTTTFIPTCLDSHHPHTPLPGNVPSTDSPWKSLRDTSKSPSSRSRESGGITSTATS